MKDSLTYRPSSQGWAPGVVLLYHYLYGVHLYCGLGWGFSILSRILIARMLQTCFSVHNTHHNVAITPCLITESTF